MTPAASRTGRQERGGEPGSGDAGPAHRPITPPGTAYLGHPAARLLAGPPRRETLDGHLSRLGRLPEWGAGGGDLLEILGRSGLTGRGGGHFPLATKVAAARRAGGRPVVVVNATESEPASAKDRLLLECRPHLVIDGAMTVAAACGADTVLVATHERSPAAKSMASALRERAGMVADPAAITLTTVPDRYIAGESSALVSYLDGGPALPASRSRPTAEEGLAGRPTVVSNTETVAHTALIARFGDSWYRQAGTATAPGSLLVTLAGDVARPGTVLEVLEPVTLSDLVDAAVAPGRDWQAVLVGGYAGTWLSRDTARIAPVAGGRAVEGAAPIGCGLLAVLDDRRCGLAEAARLVNWLSTQRAGQCGACSFGLPLLAEHMTALAAGRSGARRTNRRVASLALTVTGRGLCHLPDGTLAMAESALEVFAEEARLHRRRRCSGVTEPGALPLPPAGPASP